MSWGSLTPTRIVSSVLPVVDTSGTRRCYLSRNGWGGLICRVFFFFFFFFFCVSACCFLPFAPGFLLLLLAVCFCFAFCFLIFASGFCLRFCFLPVAFQLLLLVSCFLLCLSCCPGRCPPPGSTTRIQGLEEDTSIVYTSVMLHYFPSYYIIIHHLAIIIVLVVHHCMLFIYVLLSMIVVCKWRGSPTPTPLRF